MNTNTPLLSLSLSDDLDQVGRTDALTGIREALWGIHPRNILRSIVEEVAGSSAKEEEDQDQHNFDKYDFDGSKNRFEKTNIKIEVVDGLTLDTKVAYNRRTQQFAAVVSSLLLETNGKQFEFKELFALEIDTDIFGNNSNQLFEDFVDTHQRLADAAPINGDESQIDMLIELLFDFTNIEEVW